MSNNGSPKTKRFGVFDVDLQARELRKQGSRVKLQQLPFELLLILLDHPGELVSRGEIRQQLWPAGVYVDFDRSLNKAMVKLREALGDSYDSPLYVETLPRVGYRFICPLNETVEPLNQSQSQSPSNSAVATTRTPTIVEDSQAAAGQREMSSAHENSFARSPVTAFKILTAVVAVVAALIVAGSYRRAPRNSLSLTPLPFTALQGLEFNPTFSPDGTQIAFEWNGDPARAGRGFDLYVKVVGSEEPLRLTDHPARNIYPAWSPDGTQIAFHRLEFEGHSAIYLLPALGGPERRLRVTTSPSGNSISLSWSPDGKRLAFVDSAPSGEDSRAYLLSLDTLEAQPIPHLPECRSEWAPVFSHDGQQLAYLCWRGQQEFALYALARSTATPRLITVFYAWPSGFAWSVDDKKIILSRYLAASGDMVEIPVAKGSLQKLAFGENSAAPAIAPRGERLAYSSVSSNANIWRRDLNHPEVPATKLISSSREQISAHYSPDGAHIAFDSTRTGFREIWMSDSDGTHLVQLTKFNNHETGSARWSPDGQKIAFDSRVGGHPEIYVLDISERVPQKLNCNLQDMSLPSWSHDGKWIYFVGKSQTVSRCPSTGGVAQLLESKLQAMFPLESADSRKVFFSTFVPNSMVYQVDLEHPGEESAIPGIPVLADNSLWAPVPNGIYFIPKDSPHSLRYYDFGTAKSRLVLNVDKYREDGISVSPDGRWLIYAQTDQLNADIMLVENFK